MPPPSHGKRSGGGHGVSTLEHPEEDPESLPAEEVLHNMVQKLVEYGTTNRDALGFEGFDEYTDKVFVDT